MKEYTRKEIMDMMLPLFKRVSKRVSKWQEAAGTVHDEEITNANELMDVIKDLLILNSVLETGDAFIKGIESISESPSFIFERRVIITTNSGTKIRLCATTEKEEK